MDYEKLLVKKSQGVGIIQFNSPSTLNNLGLKVRRELQEATDDMASDNEVRVVLLTGSGRAFSAGGDVALMSEGFTSREGFEYMQDHYEWIKQFHSFPKPTIAAVNGYAVGGGFSVALLCDIIFASEDVQLGLAFRNVGLVPDLGVLYLLPKIVGINKVKELAFTGRTVKAEEALSMGLLNNVFPKERLCEESFKFARELAAGPRISYRMAKMLINRSHDMSFETELDMESLAQGICFDSEDSRDAMKAFMNKAKPKFK